MEEKLVMPESEDTEYVDYHDKYEAIRQKRTKLLS